MEIFALSELRDRREQLQKPYLEFVRVPALSVGLYVLAAGDVDGQHPHCEDEVYYVVSGRGVLRVADEDQPVQAGSVIFVTAGMEHYFHTIEAELQVLVVFGPAEYSLRKS